MIPIYHTPVLCKEVVEYLVGKEDGIYVDGTLGGGGHAEAILQKIYPKGMLIGIDADLDAHNTAQNRLIKYQSNIIFVRDNTVNIVSILKANNIPAIQGLVLDLGVSSHQLDATEKGFSFRSDDVLDMRMDRRQRLDAAHIVNSYSQQDLATLFWNYGEEKKSRRIARAIVDRRVAVPIRTTRDLAVIVEKHVGPQFLVKSMARIFQALRIEVNNELGNLSDILKMTLGVLATGGRIVVISYHSLEDRIVKKFFQDESATSIPSGHKLVADTPRTPRLRILTRKPVLAPPEERRKNPRSRSAKMRVAERL